MNRKTRAIVTGLILAMIVGLGGCLTVNLPETEAPPSAAPESEPALALPAPSPAPTITIIECPSEAFIGEYITVKGRVSTITPISPEGNIGIYKLFLWEPRLSQPGHYCGHSLGDAFPDDQMVICWYVPIPTESCNGVDTSLTSGSYRLEVLVDYPDAQTREVCEQTLLWRNIIIKE